MKKKSHDRIKFFVIYKDFNTGKLKTLDVMDLLYKSIFNKDGSISKTKFITWDENFKQKVIKNKEDLKKFINSHFIYHYAHKCEWEFLTYCWPNRTDEVGEIIDVYDQLKPNIDLIVDIVWKEIEFKLKK